MEALRVHMHGLAMTASSHELYRVILEAVSEDYQSFESIVSQVSDADSAHGLADEIERILLSSIANNLVAAYLLHADPPYATEVEATPEMIRTYWFCITEEGRKYLDGFAPEQKSSRRHERSRPAPT
jgi:hypothetical protein